MVWEEWAAEAAAQGAASPHQPLHRRHHRPASQPSVVIYDPVSDSSISATEVQLAQGLAVLQVPCQRSSSAAAFAHSDGSAGGRSAPCCCCCCRRRRRGYQWRHVATARQRHLSRSALCRSWQQQKRFVSHSSFFQLESIPIRCPCRGGVVATVSIDIPRCRSHLDRRSKFSRDLFNPCLPLHPPPPPPRATRLCTR